MERLQIGVGPRLKPPLLLRNQNKKGNVMGLFDDLMKKFGGVDSWPATLLRRQAE